MTESTRHGLAWKGLLVLALVKFAVQMSVAGAYGFHRDEYLYLAQTDHLAWGFVEVPPMLAFLGSIFTVFGDGIYVVKFLPALIGALALFLTGALAREMGGNRFAQLLAAGAFLVVPAYLRTHHLFQPVFLNQFVWLLLTWYLVKLINTENHKYWLHLGLVMGLGMLTKYSVAFPIIGSVTALLLTRRDLVLHKRFVLGAMIAILIFLPNLIWQFNHNFPVIGHMEELRATQLANVSPLDFVSGQILMLFSVSLLWIPGLVSLFTKSLRPYLPLGIMYLVTLIIFLISSGKDYYLLGMYPALIAAGAVWWESVLKRPVWRSAMTLLVIALCIPSIPYGIPVLPVSKMMTFCEWMKSNLGLAGPLVWEDGVERALPQDYADMYGWEEMVSNVSKFYHSLPDSERERCNLWGGSYGHAGALLYYAHKYDLPKDVTSFNGSFTLWAKDEADFDAQIMVDDRWSSESEYWLNIELIDSTDNPYARDRGYIFYRTDPKVNIPDTWRSLVKEAKTAYSR